MRARGEADPPARYRTALVSPVLSVPVLLVPAARRPERRAGDIRRCGQKYVWSVEDAEVHRTTATARGPATRGA